MRRLPILLGIRSDRTPAVLAGLPGVVLLQSLDGSDDRREDPGSYWLVFTRNEHMIKLVARRALPHDELLPDTATATQLGLPSSAVSAAADERWGLWWLVIEWVDWTTQQLHRASTEIFRLLNRLARSPANAAAGGGYHITIPWTRPRAAALWSPAVIDAVLKDASGNPRQHMRWDGDPAPTVQAAWSYDPSDGECDADEDLDEAALDTIYGVL